MAPLVLTAAELRELTRRDRPAAQARILRRLGIPYKEHPVDRCLLVARSAALAVIEGVPTKEATESEAGVESMAFAVNIQGIRNHGKTPRTH